MMVDSLGKKVSEISMTPLRGYSMTHPYLEVPEKQCATASDRAHLVSSSVIIARIVHEGLWPRFRRIRRCAKRHLVVEGCRPWRR